MFNFKKIAACAAAAMTLACSVTAMPTSAGWKYVYVKGDVNGDQKVDFNDLSMISLHIKGKRPISTKKGRGAADVNFDGKIDNSDIAKLSYSLKNFQFFADGDLDGDYYVDIYDLTLLEDHVLHGTYLSARQQIWADVEHDGIIDYDDYRLLKKYYNTYSK